MIRLRRFWAVLVVAALAVGPMAAHGQAKPMPAVPATVIDHAVHCQDGQADAAPALPAPHKGNCDCGMLCAATLGIAEAALPLPLPLVVVVSPQAPDGLTGSRSSPPFRPPRA